VLTFFLGLLLGILIGVVVMAALVGSRREPPERPDDPGAQDRVT
jgi:hypothetical protein